MKAARANLKLAAHIALRNARPDSRMSEEHFANRCRQTAKTFQGRFVAPSLYSGYRPAWISQIYLCQESSATSVIPLPRVRSLRFHLDP
jgi:hypothetical protein